MLATPLLSRFQARCGEFEFEFEFESNLCTRDKTDTANKESYYRQPLVWSGLGK